MADLGVLPTVMHGLGTQQGVSGLSFSGTVTTKMKPFVGRVRRPPNWRTSVTSEWVTSNGVLSGVVTEEGSPVPKCMVRLYWRATGTLITSTFTANDGTFSFTELESSFAGAYFVIAFDPDTGTIYNAIIYDRLTPVG